MWLGGKKVIEEGGQEQDEEEREKKLRARLYNTMQARASYHRTVRIMQFKGESRDNRKFVLGRRSTYKKGIFESNCRGVIAQCDDTS